MTRWLATALLVFLSFTLFNLSLSQFAAAQDVGGNSLYDLVGIPDALEEQGSDICPAPIPFSGVGYSQKTQKASTFQTRQPPPVAHTFRCTGNAANGTQYYPTNAYGRCMCSCEQRHGWEFWFPNLKVATRSCMQGCYFMAHPNCSPNGDPNCRGQSQACACLFPNNLNQQGYCNNATDPGMPG